MTSGIPLKRMGTVEEGTTVSDWTEGEKLRLRAILQSFRARTAGLDLRFPPSISVLKTTGLEEGMALEVQHDVARRPGRKRLETAAGLDRTDPNRTGRRERIGRRVRIR